MKLKGRLTFAEGQPFGRTSRAFFNSLTHHMFHCPADGSRTNDCIQDLQAFKASFAKGALRCIDVRMQETVYLFTDAHYELGKGGLGAVVFNERGEVLAWFGMSLREEERVGLNVDDKEQIITELEVLVLLASLRRKHLLAFVDNEGAQCSILRGRSLDGVLNAISHEVALLEDSLGNIAWYSRVPSASNPAVVQRKKWMRHRA